MTSHYLQPVSGVIGAVGFDGQKNAGLEALAPQQKIESKPSGMRSFNTACLCMFFMTVVFVFPFFGFIKTPQIVFYFLFLVYAVLNITFLSLSPISRENFVKARMFSVYLPSALFIAVQLTAFVFFLRDLDDINQILDNTYPVSEESQLMKQYFVIMNILLFFLVPLFMVVSFLAYTLECVRKMSNENYNTDGKPLYEQNYV